MENICLDTARKLLSDGDRIQLLSSKYPRYEGNDLNSLPDILA